MLFDSNQKPELENIYSHLGDDRSKRIYTARLVKSLLGEDNLMNQIIDEYKSEILTSDEWVEFLAYLKKDEREKYIFGYGEYGTRLYNYTKDIINWNGFIDNDSEKIGKNHDGIFVSSLDDIINNKTDIIESLAFFIPSKAYFYEIKEQLIKNGVSESSIVDGTVIYDITEGRQYFDLEQLQKTKGEVFVDGGVCDGMSSISFIKWCNGDYKKIFCFEPDEGNIDKIIRNFKYWNIEKYEIVNKGIWNKSTTLKFAAQSTANSMVVAGDSLFDVQEDSLSKIEVISLDEALGGQRVSFIKMDIEGSELNAIEGSRRIIYKHKPKLAISIYHKPEDIWEIPKKILSIRDDYIFYLRHYSAYMSETVLYGV